MSRTLLCINDFNPSIFCVNSSNLIGLQSTATAFSITDGTTTQVINAGDTITFADTSSINHTVAGTDTVTSTVKISAAAGNDLTVNADGLYVSKDNLVTGGSWDDTTNSIVLTLDGGSTISIPVQDLVGTWLADVTLAGNSGTPDVVNNHETINIVGGANTGIKTAITNNTVTINFDCAEPLNTASLPVC